MYDHDVNFNIFNAPYEQMKMFEPYNDSSQLFKIKVSIIVKNFVTRKHIDFNQKS